MKLKLFLFAFVFLIGSAEQISAQKFLDKVLKGLEKTNQVLDEADKVLGTDESGSSSSLRSSHGKRVTGFKIVSPHPDLSIEFKRCAASASTVVIDLVMTWYGDDAKIYLGGGGSGNGKNATLAYDDNGKQYDYNKIPISIGGGNWSVYSESSLFPTEVPIKVQLEVHNVSESVQMFKRLQIYMRDVNDPIMFYNLPIMRNNNTSQNTTPSELEGVATSNPSNDVLTAEKGDTQNLPKLKKIIGKWELASLKKSGKEITFKPCTLQFYDKSNDDPYTKNMTETISGKARSTGYTIMPDNDNELIATLFITDDECDNSYTIQTVDSEKLILSFGYYGDPKIQGELIFKKANV